MRAPVNISEYFEWETTGTVLWTDGKVSLCEIAAQRRAAASAPAYRTSAGYGSSRRSSGCYECDECDEDVRFGSRCWETGLEHNG